MGGTYGGNAVACAAGVATMDAMEEDGMLANATRQGEKLLKFWKGQQELYPAIGEARGKGLMLAIECVQPGTKEPNAAVAKAFIAECQKHKVILMGACSQGNGVRFLPPLNISDADMDFAIGIFDGGRQGRLRLSRDARRSSARAGRSGAPPSPRRRRSRGGRAGPFVMLDSAA